MGTGIADPNMEDRMESLRCSAGRGPPVAVPVGRGPHSTRQVSSRLEACYAEPVRSGGARLNCEYITVFTLVLTLVKYIKIVRAT